MGLLTYVAKDYVEGRPVYLDKAVIGCVIGYAATWAAKQFGVHIPAEVQGAVVVLFVGIAQMLNSHIGLFKAKPKLAGSSARDQAPLPSQARDDDTGPGSGHDLSSLS